MMRYVPTKEMIEKFGLAWLNTFEADSISDFELIDGVIKVEPGNISLPIHQIRKLFILESDCSERLPRLEDYPGVPLYYGSINIHTVYLEIVSPSCFGNNPLRLGVFNQPVCHLAGAKWQPFMPDAVRRNDKLDRIIKLFNELYPDVRMAHIEAVLKELADGIDNTECGVQNITFTQHGVKFRQIKKGAISSFFGFRETLFCRYSDVIVSVDGDKLRPDKVRVQFIGYPDAAMTFDKKFDSLCSYLIAPIVKTMADREKGIASSNTATMSTPAEQRLATLKKLLDSGAITQSEYNSKRISIIDSI